mgnify:CR=1 FL=1
MQEKEKPKKETDNTEFEKNIKSKQKDLRKSKIIYCKINNELIY